MINSAESFVSGMFAGFSSDTFTQRKPDHDVTELSRFPDETQQPAVLRRFDVGGWDRSSTCVAK
ncbi:hypothetical protein [Stieleria mannarensis]|uniref:hypothetical protein n=1 Tax=Stieleria mannarensis TaxID=2755585 RepID=UPI001604848E|nr:hypothetical protein [Rhodopirellula sp. JC639]